MNELKQSWRRKGFVGVVGMAVRRTDGVTGFNASDFQGTESHGLSH